MKQDAVIESKKSSNDQLAHYIIRSLVEAGVTTFMLCPGTRNAPIVTALKEYSDLEKIYHFEERSAAYFALGRIRRDGKPVAIVTTSGSASGELLPAVMEAFYTQIPIVLLTADRPRRFRGTCAPQSAEQVGLFGVYTSFSQDIENGELCDVSQWDKLGPAHLNVCFEDPIRPRTPDTVISEHKMQKIYSKDAVDYVDNFFRSVKRPLAIVGTLPDNSHDAVRGFLKKLCIPVILEGVSGLREDESLEHLKIRRTDQIFRYANESDYPIDGILRLGSVPVNSLWRDLENLNGKVKVCSISELPYSGLSWGDIVCVAIGKFLKEYTVNVKFSDKESKKWLRSDQEYVKKLGQLILEEPFAEASLVHKLSKSIPSGSMIYLGNSLPIREWDLAADYANRGLNIKASRGINGIDGQISTFFGLSEAGRGNWAILGDLTTLYDMAGPWVLQHMKLQNIEANIVVINNSGGQIFSKFFSDKIFMHPHDLHFKPLAEMWGLKYERYTEIDKALAIGNNKLIEIVPDDDASKRFQKQLASI